MQLSQKLIAIEVLFFTILMGGVALTIYFFALPEIRNVETQYHLTDIKRIQNGIKNELDYLNSMSTDWAAWDDTYQYSDQPYKAFETANLVPETLEDLRLDLLILINKENKILNKLANDNIGDPESLQLLQGSEWSNNHPALQYIGDDKQGIFETEIGPLLLARQPILTTRKQGPPRGYLIFAKLLNDSLVQELSEELQVDISISMATKSTLTPSVEFISPKQSHSRGYIQLMNSSDTVIQLDIDQPRPFYQQAISAVRYSLFTALILSSIACLITYIILRKVLINPIVQLQQQADRFKYKGEKQPFTALESNDELGQLSTTFIAMAKELSQHFGELTQERDQLQDSSYTDALTTLKNPRFLSAFLSSEANKKPPADWTFFTLDLDFFKQVNDNYGHDIGDVTLQQFSSQLKSFCRDQDILVRSGGEEFTVICYQLDGTSAKKLAERIRQGIEKFEFGNQQKFNLSCSIGFFSIHIYTPQANTQVWKSMLKLSDIALYAAKYSGRNTWVGLQNLSHCKDGHYPSDSSEVQHWLESKKLKLITPPHTEEQLRWDKETPTNCSE
ncbi:diguanylate cyclase [Neptuniibacter sp. QD72_48]|uniref:diguanylate cyclase n=1 Tax=unclassified Neptuniibacter TaxID=2630693 RepID=UPI0039F5A1A9